MIRLVAVLAVVFAVASVIAWVAYLLTPRSHRPAISPLVKVIVYTGVSLGLVGAVTAFGYAMTATIENFG